jgi:outer membrane receptor for ferric coprogen and ferric-rhodotorulic acid
MNGGVNGAFNLHNWDITAVPRPVIDLSAAPVTSNDLRQYGIYGQWRFKPLDNLTLIGGTRLTWLDLETQTNDQSIDAEFTPYAGIIYDLTDRISAYASFTEIFQPQTQLDSGGNIIDPRTGRQFEVGVKADVLDNVNVSLAYFNLRDENRAVSDLTSPGSFLAQGEARLQGFELEATGSLTPNWQIAGGYTYTDTEFVSTASAAGAEFYTPEHMFQLWTKYTFDERHGILDKAFIGGGVKVFSSFRNLSRTAAGGITSDIRAPGYAVVDIQAGYQFNEHLTAVVSVNNLFDEKYYERVGGLPVFNFYGAPRNVNFKISTQF